MQCPVCGEEARIEIRGTQDATNFKCLNCGNYSLTGTALSILPSKVGDDFLKKAILSYAISRNQIEGCFFELDSSDIERLLEETALPNPLDQIDSLLRMIGQDSYSFGSFKRIIPGQMQASLGALSADAVAKMLSYLVDNQLLERFKPEHLNVDYMLTYPGWRRYEELRRSGVDSQTAFMAMPFRNETLNNMFRKHFKPAVKLTGFDLQRLDERPEAGIIDNRMIVAIRDARFVVAEFTNENPGVIWEAGFAEGEGKPVIYLCREAQWKKMHFDTNHRQYVVWKQEEPEKAEEDLKACIRATFPGAAITESS